MSKRIFACSLAVIGMATSLGMALADSAPQHVQSGTYKVEPGHTQVVFSCCISALPIILAYSPEPAVPSLWTARIRRPPN